MADKKNTWKRFLSRGAIGVGAVAILALIVVAWMPKPVPVEVSEVQKASLVLSVSEDGRTRVKDRHLISAPILGNLARPELHTGDDVTEGQVLLRMVPAPAPLLDPRSRSAAEAKVTAAQAALRQAEATITRATTAADFAKKEVERQRALSGQGAVPPQVLERAELEAKSRVEELTSVQFGAKVAASELEMSRAALGLYGSKGSGEQLELRSPVQGRVLKVYTESEGVVPPGTPLLELGDPSALEVVVDVLSGDAVQIPQGAKVEIERWGGEGSLKGHVRLVEPSAFTRISALGVEEQRVNVIIDLDEAKERWQRLGDGYRLEAKIVIQELPEVLQLPSSAVFRLGERWVVYRVVDGVVVTTTVELGARNDRAFEVRSGLSLGDRVVSYPSASLSDGTQVVAR